nr:RsmG family class I SAM-dependent methyltransferase [Deinobacterium chartae]
MALRYAAALDLFGPAVQRDLDLHIASARRYGDFLPQGAEVLDVGSGGGLPGIPLALARPDLTVHLCEIRRRRASFLKIAVAQLGLKNAEVFPGDVRRFPKRLEWVTAQAVADLPGLMALLDTVTTDEWHLITRRPAGWTPPAELGPCVLAFERLQLDSDADLVHLKLKRL